MPDVLAQRYNEANLRVLDMRPLRNANLLDMGSLELVNELARLYSRIQNPWLQVMGHTPGKEL